MRSRVHTWVLARAVLGLVHHMCLLSMAVLALLTKMTAHGMVKCDERRQLHLEASKEEN